MKQTRVARLLSRVAAATLGSFATVIRPSGDGGMTREHHNCDCRRQEIQNGPSSFYCHIYNGCDDMIPRLQGFPDCKMGKY